MPKYLLLVRHGKSDWSHANLTDFDRPLNKRGKENAPEMAERLLQRKIVLDLIVSSPAKRAKSTAKVFAKAFGFDAITLDERIYEAHAATLLNVINGFDDKADAIAVFGHNPGFTDLANDLGDADLYNIPTAGMAYIKFEFDSWKMLSRGTGTLVFFDYPKNTDEM